MTDAIFERREVDVEIKGVKYTLTERALGDISEFKSYIRKRRLVELVESLKDIEIEEDERYKIIAKSQNYTISDADVQSEVVTAEGMIFMTWRAFQAKHPDVTHDAVINMFMADPDKMIEAYYALLGIEAAIAGSEDEDGKQGKNLKRATV